MSTDPRLSHDPLKDFDQRTTEQKTRDRADFDRRYADASEHHEQAKRGLAAAQERLGRALQRSDDSERHHSDYTSPSRDRGRER